MLQPAWEELSIHLISTPTVFPVGPANVFIHPGPPVTLFDAGTNTDEAFEALSDGLAAVGLCVADIDQVLLTHHHLDHIGLSRRIKEVSDARILAHREVPSRLPSITNIEFIQEYLGALLAELGAPSLLAEAVIKQRLAHRNVLDDFVIDELFDDGDEIDSFTVHYRPGHSVTDSVFVDRVQGWAVTGDHLIHRITPNPLLRLNPPTGKREKSLVQYYDSLLKTRDLEITWCLAGHGPPFQNHRQAIDSTIRHIELRGERTLKELPREGATPYEMTRRLFPRLSEASLYYCLSAAAGYLDFLEMQGKVCLDDRYGKARYFPVSAPA